MDKHRFWPIKIALATFLIGLVVSGLSEVASSASGIVIAGMIVVMLLLISVLTDAIGVAVTACDKTKIIALYKSSPTNPTFAMAKRMVVNAERVNNICADVIGDVCSIINGACGASIVIEIMKYIPSKFTVFVGIIISSVLASITVGGKAYLKTIAINKADEFIIYSAKIIAKLGGLIKIKNKHKKKAK